MLRYILKLCNSQMLLSEKLCILRNCWRYNLSKIFLRTLTYVWYNTYISYKSSLAELQLNVELSTKLSILPVAHSIILERQGYWRVSWVTISVWSKMRNFRLVTLDRLQMFLTWLRYNKHCLFETNSSAIGALNFESIYDTFKQDI